MGGIALLILLVPQLNHNAYLFQKNSQDENYLLAWMFAIMSGLADKYGNWEKANEERARFVKYNKEVISKILGKVA